MDPKVKPPTRIVVSGGPKLEPQLHMAHPEPKRHVWLRLIAEAVVAVFILWLLLSLFLLLGARA